MDVSIDDDRDGRTDSGEEGGSGTVKVPAPSKAEQIMQLRVRNSELAERVDELEEELSGLRQLLQFVRRDVGGLYAAAEPLEDGRHAVGPTGEGSMYVPESVDPEEPLQERVSDS